ncbi:MAG: hypothetical protein ACMUIA_03860 [bacterium]
MIVKECYDHLTIRCPLLGGEVPFLYCRKQGAGNPCSRLPTCWIERVDIETYIQTFFSQEEIANFFLTPSLGRMEVFLEKLENIKTMQRDEKKKQELIKAVKETATDGKISCAEATRLADQYQFPRREMGNLLDDLKIKIKSCQLGCF